MRAAEENASERARERESESARARARERTREQENKRERDHQRARERKGGLVGAWWTVGWGVLFLFLPWVGSRAADRWPR